MPTTFVQDTDDRYRWDQILTTTDDDGVRDSRFIFYDDGTTRSEDYEAGQLKFVRLTDTGPMNTPSDVKRWERIEITYDEDGNLSDRYELRDNGIQILTDYENGVRRFVWQIDSAPGDATSDTKTWDNIQTFYDENGVIDRRFQLNDDGTEISTDYENGVRRLHTQTDAGNEAAPDGVKSWDSIETFYDDQGVIESRLRVNDNGTTYFTGFEDGKRVYQLREDRDDAGNSTDTAVWDTIVFIYDSEGAIEAKETTYDDGDALAFFYEDGVRTFKYELDGDDSEDWVSRETVYDDAGVAVEVNTYDYNIFDVFAGF